MAISRALSGGTIKIDPLFWLADTFGFDFTVSRATSPILYWGGTLFLVLIAVAVLVIFAVVAASNLR
jgi:Mg2+ and Co2+ transporter CorA